MSPMENWSPLNADTDEELERRALGDDEFTHLVEAAFSVSTVHNLDGPERAILYIMAANSGFRASELASLGVESFDLNAGGSPSGGKRIGRDAQSGHSRAIRQQRDQQRLIRVVSIRS